MENKEERRRSGGGARKGKGQRPAERSSRGAVKAAKELEDEDYDPEDEEEEDRPRGGGKGDDSDVSAGQCTGWVRAVAGLGSWARGVV